MKRVLFFLLPICLLAFCSCPTPGLAEMKSYNQEEGRPDFPGTDARTGSGSDKDWASGNHGGLDFKLGPFLLGIEGKSLPMDRGLKFENQKPNKAVVLGIEFRF